MEPPAHGVSSLQDGLLPLPQPERKGISGESPGDPCPYEASQVGDAAVPGPDGHRQPERAHRVAVIKADMGYRGAFRDMAPEEPGIALECVKSNYGSSVFVPIGERWVVERTFPWLQTYRRLMRNYERYLCTAAFMTLLAMIFFMLRYFA